MTNMNLNSIDLARNHAPGEQAGILAVLNQFRRLLKAGFGFAVRNPQRNLRLSIIGALVLLPRSAFPLGAVTPFVDVEAENMGLGAGASVVSATLPPANEYSTPALEASQRTYVQLTATGQYLQWTNNTGNNVTAINVRSCTPDSTLGGGVDSTLDLYVNGTFRQALYITSKYTWIYEGTSYQDKDDENPADGDPYHFWDEEHAFITGSAVAPGDTIRLQKDSGNTAAFYYIDVVDFESPAPLTQPANSLSVMSYGAVSNNPDTDNTTAFNNCFAAALSQEKIAWIPPGTFYISPTNHGLDATGITIQGAGPWYTTVNRVAPSAGNTTIVAGIFSGDHSCIVEDLCLDTGSTMNKTTQNDGAFNIDGDNWVVNNCWIQHVGAAFWAGGSNGIVENCRVGNIWADGGNLNNVQDSRGIGMDLTYSNNFVRGTGDDAMAINSVYTNGNTHYTIMTNITYANNTGVCTWKGYNLGLYGGANVTVKNNLLRDDARSRGLAVGRFGPNGNGIASATVTGNTLWRDGGNVYNQQQEALNIGGNPPGATCGNIYCESNTIYDSLYNAVALTSATNMIFQRNTIVNPALNAIIVPSGGEGIGIVNSNTVTGLNSGYVDIDYEATDYAVVIPIEAADYDSMSGVSTETCTEGYLDMCSIENNDYAVYNNVDLNSVDEFVARVASANAGGNIEIRLDSTSGTLIGTCTVSKTGGWETWTDVYCSLSGASGTHNVYLVFTGGGSGGLFNVEFFGFYTQPAELP
jgi:hypothetical protein